MRDESPHTAGAARRRASCRAGLDLPANAGTAEQKPEPEIPSVCVGTGGIRATVWYCKGDAGPMCPYDCIRLCDEFIGRNP